MPFRGDIITPLNLKEDEVLKMEDEQEQEGVLV